MIIYVISFILMIFEYLLYNVIKNKYKENRKSVKVFEYVLFIINIARLIFILGLRNEKVGVDLQNYRVFFKYCGSYGTSILKLTRFEYGYAYYNIIISSITNNFNLFLFITSIVCVLPVAYIIKKYSKNPLLSLIIYVAMDFYFFLFSGLRQGIAFSFCFLSFKYIHDRKLFKFIILVLIAYFFHKSALVFLPAYWIFKLNVSKKNLFFFLILGTIIFIFKEAIMLFFIDSFYDNYSLIISNSYNYLLMSILILFLCLIFKKNVISISPESSGYYIFFIISVLFLIFTSTGTNMQRIANYYYMYIVFLLPEVIESIRIKKKYVMYNVMLLFILTALFCFYLYSNNYKQIPYYLMNGGF